MRGRPPERGPDDPKSVYLPQTETPEYEKMYEFYRGLGPKRSLQQVAKQFGKSIQYMGSISRAFDWRDRIDRLEPKQSTDPVVVENRKKINQTRRRLVGVVHEITDVLSELAILSKEIRRDDAPENFTPTQEQRIKKLRTALGIYGFEWKSVKDMRDLLKVMQEVVQFNSVQEAEDATRTARSGIKIDKAVLLVNEE
jgi:hypothetical protein